MAGQTMALLLLISIFYSLASASNIHEPPAPLPSPSLTTTLMKSKSAIKAGYWPSGMSSTFPASAIDTTYFTHIYFAFLLPDPTTYRLIINQDDGELLGNFTAALRGKKKQVKTLLSIGGGGSNATTFAQMVSSAANRAAFIDSTITSARMYGFDGVDFDWEFPQTQQELDNLGILFAEWRAALNTESAATGRRRLLLTSAVYFAARFIVGDNRAYPAASIAENVDWVNAMCFDYKGSWNTSATGAHAALFDNHSNVTTSFGLRSWVEAGVPRRKVVMGLPLYGRTWQLKDPSISGVGAPAVGVGPGNGTMFFNDVVDYNMKNNATVVYDGPTVSAYSYYGTAWIGYDDATSVTQKIYYARGLKLRGYFFWALGFDKDWMISGQASRAWS
ncbi:hypothetical protein MRB53_009103 [Persea americana]|uniref:Uncharacterized protein n=1 Tax=Persea americana TaxID=3435 RepID=A0ACC2LP83_PERAE|nr:hypothetical protein MRB53_009103 [Persea americana]